MGKGLLRAALLAGAALAVVALGALLVWFIAAVTSGAVASTDAVTFSVSGVPCTLPLPTTVTSRVVGLASSEPHPATPTAPATANPARARAEACLALRDMVFSVPTCRWCAR